MDRRHFLYRGVSLASLLFLASGSAFGDIGKPGATAVPQPLWKFEDVIPHLTPELEKNFDVFFFINSDIQGLKTDFVRAQHVKVIRRFAHAKGKNIFRRDEKGVVNGFIPNQAEAYAYLPVTTGEPDPVEAKRPTILTYSGIFRVNHTKSRAKYNPDPTAYMSHSWYLDFVYANGKESGVAFHGTSEEYYPFFGIERSSQGCIMIHPDHAKVVWDMMNAPEMWSNDLPDFDRRLRYPSYKDASGKTKTRPGIKALFVIFNGYKQPIKEGLKTPEDEVL